MFVKKQVLILFFFGILFLGIVSAEDVALKEEDLKDYGKEDTFKVALDTFAFSKFSCTDDSTCGAYTCHLEKGICKRLCRSDADCQSEYTCSHRVCATYAPAGKDIQKKGARETKEFSLIFEKEEFLKAPEKKQTFKEWFISF